MDSKPRLEKIAQRVAHKVSPTPKQAADEQKFAHGLMAKLSKALPEAKLHLVGSTARDTGLVGDKDIDVFAAFERHLAEEYIVKKTVEACRRSFRIKWEMHYAEHPYLQGRIENYSVEVIPCYKTQAGQKIQSAVDRTPLHMDYLQKQLSAAQRQDVRALKRLLKSNGLYGAELRIRGFSGLLCEYLILNYRSFSGLIDAVRQWKPPVRIDMTAGPGRGSSAAFDTPLVLIDAVDESRNVAAVVSATTLHRFISLCQALWEKPDEILFFPKKEKAATAAQLQKILDRRGTQWAVYAMRKPDVVEDILWPQLERTGLNIQKQLELKDFMVLTRHAFEDEKKVCLFFELQHATLPSVRRTKGPSAMHGPAVRQFAAGKTAWKGPYVEGERVWVEEKRPHTNAWKFVGEIQRRPERFGIASHLQKPFKTAKAIRKASGLQPQARGQLARFLTFREAWL
ncbi:CCA tRNA nucleotidyltransferase [Candidatus Micrarchaeota archaeon]|nr:CCA tRNA nucleotidyltransferase [Candidatus Micrarchaeota archaeon]